jgi:hypothetical protein
MAGATCGLMPPCNVFFLCVPAPGLVGREADSGLRSKKAAASASMREKATLAMPRGAQLRIRAQLGPHPTVMVKRAGLLYNRN